MMNNLCCCAMCARTLAAGGRQTWQDAETHQQHVAHLTRRASTHPPHARQQAAGGGRNGPAPRESHTRGGPKQKQHAYARGAAHSTRAYTIRLSKKVAGPSLDPHWIRILLEDSIISATSKPWSGTAPAPSRIAAPDCYFVCVCVAYVALFVPPFLLFAKNDSAARRRQSGNHNGMCPSSLPLTPFLQPEH